ncbi:hypothetical protein BV20DRAFT_941875 [Pilatotrama ljubarskyi]|nr:hypothetical protein BV20DRAFT_941875 [Pilatotrama ljubarskyi]
MLDFFLDYREAIDQITSDRKLGLRKLEITEEEWEIVQELCTVLKVFYDATQFFSRHDHPNLVDVIPAMDRIDSALSDNTLNMDFCPSVRVAAALGKKTLNKYYNKKDHSELYCIAMILHPGHKLEYFRDQNWSEEWIETAKDIIKDEYNRKYANRKPASPTSSTSDKAPQISAVKVRVTSFTGHVSTH